MSTLTRKQAHEATDIFQTLRRNGYQRIVSKETAAHLAQQWDRTPSARWLAADDGVSLAAVCRYIATTPAEDEN